MFFNTHSNTHVRMVESLWSADVSAWSSDTFVLRCKESFCVRLLTWIHLFFCVSVSHNCCNVKVYKELIGSASLMALSTHEYFTFRVVKMYFPQATLHLKKNSKLSHVKFPLNASSLSRTFRLLLQVSVCTKKGIEVCNPALVVNLSHPQLWVTICC